MHDRIAGRLRRTVKEEIPTCNVRFAHHLSRCLLGMCDLSFPNFCESDNLHERTASSCFLTTLLPRFRGFLGLASAERRDTGTTERLAANVSSGSFCSETFRTRLCVLRIPVASSAVSGSALILAEEQRRSHYLCLYLELEPSSKSHNVIGVYLGFDFAKSWHVRSINFLQRRIGPRVVYINCRV